jgi:hypothetical protein
VSLGVGALSYAGKFNILAIADHDGYPDFGVLVADLDGELREIPRTLGVKTAMTT